MSAASAFVLLATAITLDVLRIGPSWLRARVVFLAALASLRAGLHGSTIERHSIGYVAAWLDEARKLPGDAPIAQVSVQIVMACVIAVVVVVSIGCIVPRVTAKFLGKFAHMQFNLNENARFTWLAWTCAFLIAILGGVPHGWIGFLSGGLADFAAFLLGFLPDHLLGINE